jgi:protein involved in polysaccharide export with SLBB domain
VLGEVKTPGRFTLNNNEGMLDLLARAGGLSMFANEDAIYVIQRANPGPRIRFRYSDLVAADPASLRFRLHDGDVVIVE